jgi:nucleoside-diphosphate-sugar epimerase
VDERHLVTGAFGCIGSWVIRELASDGAHVNVLEAVRRRRERMRHVVYASSIASLLAHGLVEPPAAAA